MRRKNYPRQYIFRFRSEQNKIFTMAPIILYHAPISPFSRSVILLARYYKIDLEVKIIDLIGAKDHLKPEFIKINPQHSVPTIDDNGFYLWESRAILIYLVERCKPDLYPSSAQERAVLNQRLQFELGGLTAKYDNIFVSQFYFK